MIIVQNEEIIGPQTITSYMTSISRQDLIEANYGVTSFIIQESPESYGDLFYEPAIRILHKIYEEEKNGIKQ